MKYIIVLGIGFLSACSILNSSKTSSNQLLLTVGTDSVTIDEFIYAFEKNRPQDSVVLQQEVDDYLDLYTNFKLKVSEAKAQGMDTSKAFIKEYTSYVDQLNNTYLQSSNDTDSLVREAFDRLQFEINAAHILFSVDEAALPEDTLVAFNKALAIRDSIINGASFEMMATTYSDDPSAKQNNGNLGYFTVFQMVYPFESAAYSTAVNNISMPTRTRFGYHLIKVMNRRPNDGKVKVAHIMIRQSADAEKRAYAVFEQLEAGANWEELCAINSEDAQSAARGGELMPFSRSQIVPSFADAAFALETPGEISEPIQTPYGWHIIKLLEKLPVDDFNKLQQQLRAQVRRDSRSQISKNKMLDRLAQTNNLIEFNDNIQTVIEPNNHAFGKTKWNFEGDSLATLILFNISDQSYTAEDLYLFINKSTGQQKTKQFLFDTYKSFKNDALMDFEKEHLSEKYPEYKYLRQEYYDGILLFSIMENEVWEKASKDSTGLATYYEEYKNDYIDSTMIEVIIFSAPDQYTIDSLAATIPGYDDYLLLGPDEKDLLRSENNDSTQLSLRLENGEFKVESSILLKSLTLPYQNEVLMVDDIWYYVIPVRTPEEPRRMENIKGQLIADYQQVLEDSWLSELREKFPVIVNEAGLKETYKRLDTK